MSASFRRVIRAASAAVRRLPVQLAGGIDQIPHHGLLNAKALAGDRYPHTGVAVDVAIPAHAV